MYVKANSGQYSLLNRYHYYRTYTAENCIQIGYPEMCFNIAEGINRGWAPALTATDAENYYKKGINGVNDFLRYSSLRCNAGILLQTRFQHR